ncbi:hypothetical protein MNB_SM-5-660 [hydrothermal vent metagenome]|uniref:Nitric oxide-responding transcriptional regulator Dnr (Crp/Fnr family) n=1 Tax=hydrothermal vent metagenome TaxID=652676 RepID=A0A1W1CQG4_9ZZZZ
MKYNSLMVKSLLVLSMATTSILANEKSDGADAAYVAKITISQSMNKKETLALLDKVLSPFEDMTEYALDKELNGMKKGYKNIENIEDNALLKQTISANKLNELSKNIETLETLIDNAQYSKVALLSSQMFNDSVTNFKYSSKIKEQLHIEHLDYMGFKILALLSTKNPDFTQISDAISNAKNNWNAIKGKIKDENKVEAFDLLFQGLDHSLQIKDKKMLNILAQMDLALVDVVEVVFE